jgi:hypothetical protein
MWYFQSNQIKVKRNYLGNFLSIPKSFYLNVFLHTGIALEVFSQYGEQTVLYLVKCVSLQ